MGSCSYSVAKGSLVYFACNTLYFNDTKTFCCILYATFISYYDCMQVIGSCCMCIPTDEVQLHQDIRKPLSWQLEKRRENGSCSFFLSPFLCLAKCFGSIYCIYFLSASPDHPASSAYNLIINRGVRKLKDGDGGENVTWKWIWAISHFTPLTPSHSIRELLANFCGFDF